MFLDLHAVLGGKIEIRPRNLGRFRLLLHHTLGTRHIVRFQHAFFVYPRHALVRKIDLIAADGPSHDRGIDPVAPFVLRLLELGKIAPPRRQRLLGGGKRLTCSRKLARCAVFAHRADSQEWLEGVGHWDVSSFGFRVSSLDFRIRLA